MVITSFDHNAVTPAGKPIAVPMPVASVVLCVILAKGELMHKVGVLDAIPTVLVLTVIVPVALHKPPVNGIE